MSIDSTDDAGIGLRLQLLGTPQLSGRVAGPLTLERHDAALLALLAIDGATPRSRAAQLLWPMAERPQAARNLRQRLFRLRRQCGVELIEGSASLALKPGVVHDLQGLAECLLVAPDAGGGELLGTLDYGDVGAELADWVAGQRERWRARRASLLADIAEQCEGEGRLADALNYAQRLVDDETSAEHAHRRVMRLHYRRGDRAAALAAFDRCRTALHRELGEAPGAETLELAALIGRADAVIADAVRGVASAPTPVSLLRPPRLVGRDADLETIAQAWGRGLVVVLRGEAGIGKTRLAEAAGQRAAPALLLPVRPGDAERSYAVIARLLELLHLQAAAAAVALDAPELRRLLPALGAPPPGDLDEARLCVELATVLLAVAAGSAVEAVIVDDLQFADDASVRLLRRAVEATRATATAKPLRWLFAARNEAQPDELQRWLDGPSGDALLQWRLQPLSRQAVGELVESLVLGGVQGQSWGPTLWHHAGGNPMFTLETLRATLAARGAGDAVSPELALAMPAHVGQLIERRLQRLPVSALRLARLAALAESDFSVPLASALLGAQPLDLVGDWKLLEDAQVLRGDGFAHDLVREAVLRGVPDVVASEMHRRIAPLLSAQGAEPVRVAVHWQRAEEWPAAAAAYETAASVTGAAGLRIEEMRCCDEAATCWQRAGHAGQAFDALLRAAEAGLSGAPLQAVEQRLHALSARSPTAVQEHQLQLLHARVLVHRGLPEQALAPAQAAWAGLRARAAPAEPDPAERSTRETLALLAAALASNGRGAEALPLLQPVVEQLAAEPDPALRASLYSSHGFALAMDGRVRAAVESWRQGAQAAQGAGLDADAMTDWSNAAGSLAWLGDADAAFDAGRRALQLGEQGAATNANSLVIARMTFGMLAIAVGRFAESESALLTAVSAFGADPGAAMLHEVAENHLANLYLHLGQFARAQRLLTSAPALNWRRYVLLGRLAQIQGRPAQARAHLQAALASWNPAQREVARWGIRLEIATLAEPAAAATECRAVLEDAQAADVQAIVMLAQLRLAQALLADGRRDEAGALAATAAARAAEVAPYDVSRSALWWQLAQIFESCGRRHDCSHALQHGRAWMQQTLAFVPDAYRESFLQRNPVNRALLVTPG